MAKLVFGILMTVIWWMIHALQIDEELALNKVFEAKRAINRAAHAAAQQVNQEELEQGRVLIQEEMAKALAIRYLMENLRLDDNLQPLPDSFLREAIEVKVFEIVNSDETFPYIYRNGTYDFEAIFEHPGVVMIVHVKYPRVFAVLSPIEWDLKGAAELVVPHV
ncbi:MAG: hypothetical protein P0Y55_03720 [Candidatus Cohnella colombiensis]|uniref:Uncharacterized protein n=1 Tax=Candidatus Cohnella colombiensis TaxID=3121368 RepID=A0AA95EXA7_9BACL|nr:MAG: hypothetical protein P0Y55_03720 [Cohnella sp.]